MQARPLVTAVLVAVMGLAVAADPAAGQAEPQPSIIIGDADCSSLTVEVIIDNRAVSTDRSFELIGTREDGSRFEELEIHVAAGELFTYTVELPAETRVTIRVVVPGGTDQSKVVECLDPVSEPQASIGSVDCDTLTVPITLSNPRAAPATFAISVVKEWPNWPDGDPVDVLGDVVVVPASESQVVRVPVADHSGYSIEVATEDVEEVLASVVVACTALDPRVTIGTVDCATLTVPITIDNSRSAATALLGLYTSSAGRRDDPIVVLAGATRVLRIAVPNGIEGFVIQVVPVNGRWNAAADLFDVDCVVSGAPTSPTSRPTRPATSPRPPPRSAGSAGQLPTTGGLREVSLLVGLALVSAGAAVRLLARSRD